ncbi:hypothetical protein, partial [Prevotella bivia]
QLFIHIYQLKLIPPTGMYEKNDFKMLESIGSALSKDELRVIIGSGENLQVGTTEVEAERGGGTGRRPCDGKHEDDFCIWHGKYGRCEYYPFSFRQLVCVVRDFK